MQPFLVGFYVKGFKHRFLCEAENETEALSVCRAVLKQNKQNLNETIESLPAEIRQIQTCAPLSYGKGDAKVYVLPVKSPRP